MTPISTRSAHRARVLAGLLATVVVVGGLPLRAEAQTAEDLGEDIAAKRAEAARIADEVEALGEQASVALEAFRQAQAALEEADAALFETRGRVEALRRRYERTQAEATDRVLAMYRGESAPNPMTFLDAADAKELGVRQHYANVVAGRDRRALSRLGAEREDLQAQETALAEQREAVAAQTDIVRAQRDEVTTAMQDRQAALARAEGELTELVEAEQARRAAEEEARVREAARRRAEEALRPDDLRLGLGRGAAPPVLGSAEGRPACGPLRSHSAR